MATVGSLFSGIGGFDLGLERAGWEVRWQVENEPFCNKVLRRHWPDVKRYGDITAVDTASLERVDLICGGFPCQDVSVAGKREGLAGVRSSLFWEFVRIAGALRPRWVLVENVPGLFSSNLGRDFQAVINGLVEFGYGVAWRVLDSQNFGVPQRRRRVFIVGHLGAPCPPEVLFEPESGERHPAESQQAWPAVTDTLGASADRISGKQGQLAPALRRRFDSSSRDGQDIAYALRAGRTNPDSGGNQGNVVPDTAFSIPTHYHDRGDGTDNYIAGTVTGAEAHNGNSNPIPENYAIAAPIEEWQQNGGAISALVSTSADPDRVRETTGVPRRLDSPRYRALGNAVSVPVAQWVGERILKHA